jgi:acetyltransferase-like isoleucine patch superfamily enzyme
MGRLQRDDKLHGVVFRAGCRLGGGLSLCPSVQVGADSYVAAGGVVMRDVPQGAMVMGIPARIGT